MKYVMHRPARSWLALSLFAFLPTACAGGTDTPSLTGGSGGTSAAAGAGGAGGSGNAGGGGASATGGASGAAATAGSGPTGGASGTSGTSGQSGAGGVQAGAAGSAGSGVAAAAGLGGSPAGGAAGSAGSGGAGGPAGAGGAPAGGSAGSASGAAGSAGGINRPARVLLYSLGSAGVISDVPAQLDTLRGELEGWQYEVEESVDPGDFTDDNLSRYAAVGMINTCFSPFGQGQAGTMEAEALQRFVKAGGGLFGTHCASVTFQSQNPVHLYNRVLGGRANSENFDGPSSCRTLADHPTTTGLPDTFQYSGNLDNTDFIAEDATVLVNCLWSGGGAKDVAVSWVRTDVGRVFYTNFAKVDADLTNATIGDPHIIAGLAWVLGR
jgi:hypothetical protein